jgi:hypothetical protein
MLAACAINAMITLKQWLQTEAPVRRCQDPEYFNEYATVKFKMLTSLKNITRDQIKKNYF